MKTWTKKLWLLRLDKIKSNLWVWILFVVSIAISFAINAIVDDKSEASCTKALVAILSNVSYGYIAGFLFYLLSDFIPSTSKELDTINFNIGYLRQLITTMDAIEESILKEKKSENDKAWTMASFMADIPIIGLNLVDKGEDIVVPLNQNAINIITYGRKRIDDYVSPNLIKGGLSSDPIVSYAVSLSNGFFNLSRTFWVGNRMCINSRELGIVCEEYYVARQCIETVLKDFEKYYYGEELQTK